MYLKKITQYEKLLATYSACMNMSGSNENTQELPDYYRIGTVTGKV